jgi:hypothetical protein
MEKTFTYAINEAHRMGWQSARLSHSFNPMALREMIAQEIEAAREPYLELAKDKTSEEYKFYNGYCNGLFLATLIARGKNAH